MVISHMTDSVQVGVPWPVQQTIEGHEKRGQAFAGEDRVVTNLMQSIAEMPIDRAVQVESQRHQNPSLPGKCPIRHATGHHKNQ